MVMLGPKHGTTEIEVVELLHSTGADYIFLNTWSLKVCSFLPHRNSKFKKKLFIYLHVHKSLGHFFPILPSPPFSPLPSVPGRSCSAFIINFVEVKTQA
jgi:hypothetical protein